MCWPNIHSNEGEDPHASTSSAQQLIFIDTACGLLPSRMPFKILLSTDRCIDSEAVHQSTIICSDVKDQPSLKILL